MGDTTSKMGKWWFVRRLLSVIIPVVTFHIVGIEVLVYLSMNAAPGEVITMLTSPLPWASMTVIVYCLLTFYYCKPVFSFIENEKNGLTPEPELIQLVRNRLVNLPYWIAGLSFPAYILGALGGVYCAAIELDWPISSALYGFPAGIIAGLLTTPMSVYLGAWIARPVLDMIGDRTDEKEASSLAGIWFPLSAKFVLIIGVMVIGITGYTLIIGYSQIDSLMNNMKKMERLLPDDARAELVDSVDSSADPGIRSSAYYRNRLGNLKYFFISVMIAAAIFATVLAVFVSRETVRPIELLRSAAERIREGNYGEPVRFIGNDEFVELGQAFNRMRETLALERRHVDELLSSIRNAVETLAPVSQSLVSISGQQSSSSMEQATAAEEAVTTSQEIVSVAKQIAENASKAATLGEETGRMAEEGRRSLDMSQAGFDDIAIRMEEIHEVVGRLGEQYRDIGAVVNIIDDISEQTNLLALNAEIEAVGAGSNGRRFGVVAGEIRRLAANVSRSTKRIHESIAKISESVEAADLTAMDGNRAVGAGRETMNHMADILGSILRANTESAPRLKEIGIMTSQQATASEQMTSTVNELRDTALQGSSAASEIQASLEELETLVTQLRTHIQANGQT